MIFNVYDIPVEIKIKKNMRNVRIRVSRGAVRISG